LANLLVGFFMEGLKLPLKGIAIWFHVSTGFTILALTVIRIGWRLTHRAPSLLPAKTRWEPALAHTVHFLLYALMLTIPLSGWALISANPPPAKGVTMGPGTAPRVWGMLEVPLIAPLQRIGATPRGIPRQKRIHDRIVDVHETSALLMISLLALHLLGALKHQLLDGQREFRRMSFPLRRSARGQRQTVY
jgi:cytochrome b561